MLIFNNQNYVQVQWLTAWPSNRVYHIYVNEGYQHNSKKVDITIIVIVIVDQTRLFRVFKLSDNKMYFVIGVVQTPRITDTSRVLVLSTHEDVTTSVKLTWVKMVISYNIGI